MSWPSEDDAQSANKELVRFELSGSDAEWARLQDLLFAAVERTVAKVNESLGLSSETSAALANASEDITRLAGAWAKAKLERPTLENEQIRAEITARYAEATRASAEATKFRAEAADIDARTRERAVAEALENLERVLRIVASATELRGARLGGALHVKAGPPSRALSPITEEPGAANESVDNGLVVDPEEPDGA